MEEGHHKPLAKSYEKSDGGFGRENHSNKCLVYILVLVVLLSIAFLVFGLLVLRIAAPTIRLQNVAVRHQRFQTTSLNMTLALQIRLRNSNFGRFNFHGGTTTLLYGNATLGSAHIDDGGVGKRGKRSINATVEVKAAFGGGNFSRDVELGLVKLTSLAELRGEICVVRVVRCQRTAVMNCTMDLNLTSGAIQDLSC